MVEEGKAPERPSDISLANSVTQAEEDSSGRHRAVACPRKAGLTPSQRGRRAQSTLGFLITENPNFH